MADEATATVETPVESAPPATESTPAAALTGSPGEPLAQDDPFSQLGGAMDELLPKDEAAAAPEGAPAGQETPQETQIPEQLQQALGISPFVTSPEAIPQAIQAADEVWKVASGQLPARALLEGFRQANPGQFQAIAGDIASYLQSQGLIQAPPSPLEQLKGARPDVYNAIAQFVQQQTGQALDAPPDPYHDRLSAIEQNIAAEREQQETAAWNAQVEAARMKAGELLAVKTKGTFAEGLDDRYIAPGGILWQKAQQMRIPAEKMMAEVLGGKTDTFDRVWKAVEKDEAAIIRKFNANLVKQHNALKNAVPATKGIQIVPRGEDEEFPPQKPGESTVDYGVRLMRMGKKKQA